MNQHFLKNLIWTLLLLCLAPGVAAAPSGKSSGGAPRGVSEFFAKQKAPYVLEGAKMEAPARIMAPAAVTASGSEICGLLLSGNKAAITSFGVSAAPEFKQLKALESTYSWTVGVYVKGTFYTLGSLMNRLFVCNGYDSSAGWSMTSNARMTAAVYEVSMTYSETDDKVYGCFGKTAGMSSFEFGTFDVKTGVKTPVADLAQSLPAIGTDDAGTIYAIGEDGALYTVNKATAALTKVGETGVTPGSDLQSMTYDKKGGYFCWVVSNSLYAVDKASGKAEKIATMPSAGQWTGIFVKEADTPVIPTWVDDMKLDFVKDALSGTVSFVMPVKDTSGASLAGMLQYEIDIDGEVLKGDAEAGKAVSREVTLTCGSHTFKVIALKNGMPGRESTQIRFIGHDVPASPAPVNVTEHSSDNVEITWSAVTAGEQGGYIDAANVRYKVMRQPGDVVIGENITANSIVDRTVPSMGYYTYEVTVSDGALESSKATSENKLLGQSLGIRPPYSFGFGKDGFGFFTQLDRDKDGYAWGFDKDYNLVWLPINPEKGSDDWLISPPFQLEKGKHYNLKYNLYGSMYGETHRVEILLGTSADPASMTKIIFPASNFNYWLDVDKWFEADADGVHYIALHVVSSPVEGAMYTDGFSLSVGVDTNAPVAVKDLKVTAAPKAAMSATIEFTCPSLTFGGANLASISGVKVTNVTTGREVEVKDSPAPGKKLSVLDENPVTGMNQYSVACVNNAGLGLAVADSAWVGHDVPAVPGNVVWKRLGENKVRVTWDTPAGGLHGGYIDPQKLKYNVCLAPSFDLQAGEISGNSVEFEPVYEGRQIPLAFYVIAESEGGAGASGLSNTSAFGTPYEAPFYENFERAEIHSAPWLIKPKNGNSPWNILTDLTDVVVKPFNDNGMIVYTPLGKDHCTALETPIVDISSLTAPALKFWVFMFDDQTKLDILASTDCWATSKKIGTIAKAGRDGWSLATTDLSAFKGEKNLQLAIEAVSESRGLYVIVDKISIANCPAIDLSITGVEFPDKISSGSDVPVAVKVTNNGSSKAEKYSFEIFVNDEKVFTKDGSPLYPDAVANEVFAVPLSPEINRLNLVVNVNCEGDENPDDNIARSSTIPVEASRMPVPADLANNSATDDKIELVWKRPVSQYKAPVTDNLESYEAGSIGGIDVYYDPNEQKVVARNNIGKIGPYKLIDNDRLITTYVQGVTTECPNLGRGMVCHVIDVPMYTLSTSSLWSAHSGNRLFCFWKAIDTSGSDKVANDDYLILPRLDENDPYMSFWAKSITDKYGLESFDIMYSTGGSDVEDFKLFRSVTEVPAGYKTSPEAGYTFYEFYLPEGTTYAAIRYNTKNGGAALLVDDITCTPADTQFTQLVLKGYNVYRNKEKINSDIIPSESFTDIPQAEGNYVYNVTSVFDLGESRFSNSVNVDGFKGGIDDVTATDGLNVSTDGRFIIISGAEGLNYMICTPDGRIEASGVSSASTRIRVEPGIHIVRVGDKAVSVLVK